METRLIHAKCWIRKRSIRYLAVPNPHIITPHTHPIQMKTVVLNESTFFSRLDGSSNKTHQICLALNHILLQMHCACPPSLPFLLLPTTNALETLKQNG